MNKTTKIITIALGVVGSILLCSGLFIEIFSLDMPIVNKKADLLYDISLPFLFAFFIASSFVFTQKNIVYKVTRCLNALAMSLSVALVTLNTSNINPNFVFIIISGSLLFYNICDFLFRKIKLPQIFVVIPMISFFIYEIVNYTRNNTISILIGTIGLTILFALHLISKSLPLLKEKKYEVIN